MRISIAMATYNGERFVREQLDSLARQELRPCELVICDDCSTDRTLAIVQDFAQSSPFPVRVHRNAQNLGWQDNFVGAALRCKGDWIAFCDQDDVWLPVKLSRIAQYAHEHEEVVMIVHSAALVSESLEPTGSRLPDIRRFRLAPPLHNHPLLTQLGFASCFRRELLEGVPVDARPCDPNIPERRQSHDQLITLLANALGTVAYLPEVLVLYRRHGNAATGHGGTGAHERSLRTLFTGVMKAGSDRYQFQSEIAYRNASFLEQVQQSRAGADDKRLQAAAEFYRSLGDWLARRSDLYRSGQSMSRRVEILTEALSAGAYFGIGRGVGLGFRSLLKDVALTAIQPVAGVLSRQQQ